MNNITLTSVSSLVPPQGWMIMAGGRRIKGRHLVWDGSSWVKPSAERIGQRVAMVLGAARRINASDADQVVAI